MRVTKDAGYFEDWAIGDVIQHRRGRTFTQEEKDALADVTAGATMSLSDSHGDILGAIRKAFENRQPALSLGE